jgi:hypothetical protein
MKNPEYVADLEGRVIKLRTDNEIMSITMKHLQDELNNKSDLIRRQQQEMSELRTMLLDLQSENQKLRNGQGKQRSASKENYGGRTIGQAVQFNYGVKQDDYKSTF